MFRSDYPRGLVNCLWLWWFPIPKIKGGGFKREPRPRTTSPRSPPFGARRRKGGPSEIVFNLMAARELERSEPRGPGETAGRVVVLRRVPERARVLAVESHARVVAPAIDRIRL